MFSSKQRPCAKTFKYFNLLLILFIPCVFSWQVVEHSLLQNDSVSCPLNFGILRKLGLNARLPNLDTNIRCLYIRQGLRLVQAEYLRANNSFLPPLDSAESCWSDFQTVVSEFIPNMDVGDIRRSCGFQTSWIAQGCMNITTRAEFESRVPRAVLNDTVESCIQSLENNSGCAACTTSLSQLQASYLTGPSIGNLSDCPAYVPIYAAGAGIVDALEVFGPLDQGIGKCLFSIDDSPSRPKNKRKPSITFVFAIVCPLIFAVGISVFCYLRRKKKRNLRRKFKSESSLGISRLDSIGRSTTLVKFTFDEIKAATKNFSRENIIGRGGFGNVYKGVLPDGSEVALKRFKNASAAKDANFTHEVEVIGSVQHVNLVALRGYCVATTQLEGHQRIIVCDLMKGSLYDHLFGGTGLKLSWPVRQKIALGTATGLAYLHYGAEPAIIHRDIKASNILLDESFEAKVADFGLAKFTPEGMTHLSTRVAGTMGYVAPEYALYGQLTERSDVYSFGIVLLELLSGKKALLAVNDGQQPTLLNDWAWSLVREDRTLDIIDGTIPDLGPPGVMEKYVVIALLCSHPLLYARPTMDQVVKMLDTEIPVPSIPDWPLPLTGGIHHIEKSLSNGGSAHLSASRI